MRSLAARAYGDANLWYLIAEENGLSEPDAALVAGTALTLPNRVASVANDALSFKPYDYASAIGDTTPTPMQAKGGGCGIVGQIVILVVAIIVTIYTAGAASGALAAAWGATAGTATAASVGAAVVGGAIGAAAGSVASQGVGMAIGAQDQFSWSAVARAAVGGAIGGALFGVSNFDGSAIDGVASTGLLNGSGAFASGVSSFAKAFGSASEYVQSAAYATISNVITQGASKLLKLQDSFSWRDVATSALAAMGAQAGRATARASGAKQFWSDASAGAGSVGVRLLRGGTMSAGEIVVDVFGNAIANSLVEKSAPPQPSEGEKPVLTSPTLEEMQANIAELGNLLDKNPSEDSGISMEENAAQLAAGNSAIELLEGDQANTGSDSANSAQDESSRKWQIVGENRDGKPIYSAAGPSVGTMQRITDGTRPYYDPNQHLPEWGPLTPYQNERGVMAWGYQDDSGETHYVRMSDPSKETGIQGEVAGVAMAIGRTAGNYRFALAEISAVSQRTPQGRAAAIVGYSIGAASFLYLTGQRRYDTPASPFMQGDQVLPPVYVNPNNGPAMPWTEVFPADPQAGEPTFLPYPAIDQSMDDFVTSYPIADPLNPVYSTPIDQGAYLNPVMLSSRFPQGVNSVGDLTRLPLTQQITLDDDLQQAIWDYNMGPAPGMIRHHLIVRQALIELPELMRKAAEGGFNIHGTNNGIVLDPNDHIGGHPEYNTYVLKALRDIDLDLSNVEIAARVQGMSDALRIAIKDGWVPRK